MTDAVCGNYLIVVRLKHPININDVQCSCRTGTQPIEKNEILARDLKGLAPQCLIAYLNLVSFTVLLDLLWEFCPP